MVSAACEAGSSQQVVDPPGLLAYLLHFFLRHNLPRALKLHQRPLFLAQQALPLVKERRAASLQLHWAEVQLLLSLIHI